MFEPTTTGQPTPPPPPPPSSPQFGAMPPLPPTGPGAAPAPSQPKVFTMPEKFRSPGGSGPSGGSTKKLVIILVVVVVLAGLGIGGLYLFQNVFNKPANDNANVANTNTAANDNVNAIENTNGNTNANENTNSNENTNVAENSNANANANANANSNTNTSPALGPLESSADADADGLTDVEEAVYGTDAAKPDTDADGFLDGKQVRSDNTIIGEFYNGYNPKGTGRLEDSGLVKRQTSATNDYSILVPTGWTAVVDSSGGILVTPTQDTTEYFQSQIFDNASSQAPADWYKAISPNADIASLKTLTVNGLEGLYSEDESTIYLFKGTKVYTITYTTGAVTQANYRTTFDMIVLSFRLVSAS